MDDTLFAGDNEVLVHMDNTSETFYSKSREFDKIFFAGVYGDAKEDVFLVHRSSYIERICPLDLDATFDQLRYGRVQLTWLIHTRPDIFASKNILAQVTKESFHAKQIREFNNLDK